MRRLLIIVIGVAFIVVVLFASPGKNLLRPHEEPASASSTSTAATADPALDDIEKRLREMNVGAGGAEDSGRAAAAEESAALPPSASRGSIPLFDFRRLLSNGTSEEN